MLLTRTKLLGKSSEERNFRLLLHPNKVQRRVFVYRGHFVCLSVLKLLGNLIDNYYQVCFKQEHNL